MEYKPDFYDVADAVSSYYGFIRLFFIKLLFSFFYIYIFLGWYTHEENFYY